MKRITLLNNAQISDFSRDFARTILKTKISLLPLDGAPVSLEVKYRHAGKTQTIFKVYNVKFNSIEDIVTTIFHHIQSADKSIKYDKLSMAIRPYNLYKA